MITIGRPYLKISCLLVTANNRFDCFERSFKCYCDQIYSNRELVIVNEGSQEYQQQIAEHISGRDDVRLIFLDGEYSLGALRNISIALCHGDIFVQWDDDDFNAPERLTVQYNHLIRHPEAKVCFLTDQLHYYFGTQTLFWNNWWRVHSGGWKKFGLIPGTIMAHKEGFPYRYPSAGEHSAAGEDSVLAYDLCDTHVEQVLLLEDMGYLHVYSFHGKNVWDIDHHMNISMVRGLPCDYLVEHRDRIAYTLDYLKLADNIKVMGGDGLAFIHEAK